MKKLVFSLAVVASLVGFTNSASAQAGKIGYISTEELISSMPEAEAANSQLQDYQKSLQQQGNDYYVELNEKDSIFQADSSKYTETQKQLKRQDLIALYQKVQGWQQTSQQMVQEKSQALVVPIRTKAFDAIKAVAKESGYAYVLESQAVLVGPPGDDILPLVKKKLNIKDAAPAAAPGKAPAKKQ